MPTLPTLPNLELAGPHRTNVAGGLALDLPGTRSNVTWAPAAVAAPRTRCKPARRRPHQRLVVALGLAAAIVLAVMAADQPAAATPMHAVVVPATAPVGQPAQQPAVGR
jgi:hypothetical protein